MSNITQAKTNIWQDTYFRNLQISGRLAYLYVISHASISIEDMCLATDLEFSEAVNYVEQFRRDGKL